MEADKKICWWCWKTGRKTNQCKACYDLYKRKRRRPAQRHVCNEHAAAFRQFNQRQTDAANFLISGASGGMLAATYYRELYRQNKRRCHLFKQPAVHP